METNSFYKHIDVCIIAMKLRLLRHVFGVKNVVVMYGDRKGLLPRSTFPGSKHVRFMHGGDVDAWVFLVTWHKNEKRQAATIMWQPVC